MKINEYILYKRDFNLFEDVLLNYDYISDHVLSLTDDYVTNCYELLYNLNSYSEELTLKYVNNFLDYYKIEILKLIK